MTFACFVVILFPLLAFVTGNVIRRAQYPEGIPGLHGHATFVVQSNTLHPESLYYSNDPKEVTLVFGGISNFVTKYIEVNPQVEKILHNEVFILDVEQNKMVPFVQNITDPLVLSQKRKPLGRAHFDFQVLGGHVLWISGGVKMYEIDDSFYSGIAESCSFGDVWTFNVTSGLWNQLVSYETNDLYIECESSKHFENGKTDEIVFTYLLFSATVIGTISLFFWILCNS